MIEKILKTTKGKLRIKIPTSLDEITLGQMMEMQEKPDLNDFEAISILSGISIEELQNVREVRDFAVFEEHVLSLSHQIKYLYNSDAIPDKVNFYSGKQRTTVKVVRNLSVEPAGAFMAARDIIAEEINEHIEQLGEDNWKENFNPSLKACCQVLAHYFFCRVTNKKYNEYEAEEFINEVKKLRVTEALPIAKHFFTGRTLKKAIVLLNQAIKLDSSYFIAYLNKFDFQVALKQSDSARVTGNQLIKLAPQDGVTRLIVGEEYERMGDTVASAEHYRNALMLLDKRLDHMDVQNKNYISTQESKAEVLILLNQSKKAHKIFQDLYANNPNERGWLQMDMSMNRHDIIYGKTTETTISGDSIPKNH